MDEVDKKLYKAKKDKQETKLRIENCFAILRDSRLGDKDKIFKVHEELIKLQKEIF